jgi:pilus assembly protein CpaB
MNLRKILLLAVAAMLTILTVWMVRSYLDGQKAELDARARALQQPRAVAQGTMVLVAKSDLPTGSFIKPEHLRWQPWPDDGASYVRQSNRRMEEFVGSVVRARIAAGEPVTDGRVVKPDDRGFMAAVLTPGMRAISVAVNPTSGISGFVLPGDRVDLVLTHAIKSNSEGGGGGNSQDRHASETILSDLRVLAIGQKIQEAKNGETITAGTATLEVSPKQVEVIAVAIELGKLSLSLRSLGKTEGEDNEYLSGADIGSGKPLVAGAAPGSKTYTWDQEASQLLFRRITVFRGTAASEVALERSGQ